MSLTYRPSYDGTGWRVTRVRNGTDEHTLLSRFPNVHDALRAVDRLYGAHGMTIPPVPTDEDEEAYWRRIAIDGDFDDEGPGI